MRAHVRNLTRSNVPDRDRALMTSQVGMSPNWTIEFLQMAAKIRISVCACKSQTPNHGDEEHELQGALIREHPLCVSMSSRHTISFPHLFEDTKVPST